MKGLPKKILIVEDAQALAQAIKDKLMGSGFIALVANDGAAGLSLALAEHPDLIMLDLIMPKMHGMEMLKQLRLDDWGREVPVFIITNVKEDYQEKIAKEQFNAEYFVKAEWRLEDIIKKINERLTKK